MPNAGDTCKDALLRDLVDDATLVASFGLRAGVLTSSRLAQAIQRAEALSTLGWRDEEAVELQESVNEAVRAIRPVSLVDLRAGWDPFRGDFGSASRLLSRLFFVLVALILMTISVAYTQWQKEAEYVVALHQQGKRQLQIGRISAVYENYLAENPSESINLLKDPGSSFRLDLKRKLDEIQSLQYQIQTNRKKYNDVLRDVNLFVFFGDGLDRIRKSLLDWTSEGTRQKGTPPVKHNNYNNYDDCYDRYIASVSGDQVKTDPDTGVMHEFKQSSMLDAQGVALIRCVTGTNVPGIGEDYDQANLNGQIEIFSLWILPALFGMLGAVIYHLRACLDKLRPDPRFGRALMRTFLGGFGGVAFGWFWSPVATNELIATSLPLGAYAVAFLIGYSIDVFYAILDKIVVLVTRSIDRLGTPVAKT